MSGYLVGGSVVRSRRQGRWSWPSYLLTRFTRLYIVLIPALILGGLVDYAGMHQPDAHTLYSGQSGMVSLKTNVYQTLNAHVLLGNLVFMQTDLSGSDEGHHVPTFGSNGPLWSLSNEFWCYIAFPVIMIALARVQKWQIRLLCIAALAAWGWLVGIPYVLMCASWFMGVLLVYLPPIRAKKALLRYIFISLGFIIFVAAVILEKTWEVPFTATILGFAIVAFLWAVIHCATGPLPAAYIWLSQRAARSSYTLYLIHMPLVVFLKAWLHLPFAVPNPHTFLIALAVLIGIVLFAQLIYECFEKQTDRVRNWIKPYLIRNRTA
jgi:peptidoglycan/LPS O-acetylase OafA/YrhL